MIRISERERIAAYKRGWNDAQCNRKKRAQQLMVYIVGYLDAKKQKNKNK